MQYIRRLGEARFSAWGSVFSADVASDGRVVMVTWQKPARLSLYRPDGSRIRSIGLEGYGGRVRFSPDGTQVLLSRGDACEIRDATTGAVLRALTTGRTHAAVFSPDGTQVAVAQEDTVLLLETATGAVLHTLSHHEKSVWSLAFSPTGQRLATGGWDHRLALLDPHTGQLLASRKCNNVRALAFSPDGTALLAGSGDGRIHTFSPDLSGTASLIGQHTLERGEAAGVQWIGSSPDSQRIYSTGNDRKLRAWTRAGSPLWAQDAGMFSRLSFTDAALSPDGAIIYVANTTTELVRVTCDGVRLPSGAVKAWPNRLELGESVLASSDDHSERWSSEGSRIEDWRGGKAITVGRATLSSWRGDITHRPSGQLIGRFGVGLGEVHGAHILQTRRRAAHILHADTLAPAHRLDLPECEQAIASPDGRTLAVRSSRSLALWSLQSGLVEHRLDLSAHAMAFSPDSEQLAAVVLSEVVLVSVRSGKHTTIPGPQQSGPCRLCFLGTDRIALSAAGEVHVWDGQSWSRAAPPDLADLPDLHVPSGTYTIDRAWPMAISDGVLAAIGLDACIHLWSVPGVQAPVRASLALPPPRSAPFFTRLAGSVFCLSGSFSHLPKAVAKARIQALGGRVAGSPVKALTHLVYGVPKYSGPIAESSADRKVKLRIAAGADITRWSEGRLITELTPSPEEAAAQIRTDPADLIAWMTLLARQPVADLRRLNLVRQDLSGCDLRTIPLEGASLHSADLRGADLRGIRPYRVMLVSADLREARMAGIVLSQSNLHSADLRGADLADAMLSATLLGGARFAGAKVDGLRLKWCDLRGADLSDLDLSTVTLTDNTWDASTRWPAGYSPAPSRA